MLALTKNFRQVAPAALVIATALCAPLAKADQTVPQSARYSLTDNGTAVMDSKTGLVWKRCEEGKRWENGVCRGLGIKYTWSDLDKLESAPWRLPTADELKSLKEDTGVAPPINREFFPNTDRAWFWTSSADKRDATGCIQNVYFGNNITPLWCPPIRANMPQLALHPAFVRLVRSAP
jgi:hypothetical protein